MKCVQCLWNSVSGWETDTLIGQGRHGVLVSLVERRSRFTIDQCQAEMVSQATISLLKPFAEKVHTMTGDNGTEFANHAQIAKTLKVAFNFAQPYSARECGTNENTNG